jgi:hypothetical protein
VSTGLMRSRGSLLLGVLLMAGGEEVAAQGASDLFLIELRQSAESFEVGGVRRLTDRDGYDNQPHFLADGRTLLFTGIDGTGQADIHRIDLTTGEIVPVTRTDPESEYSATPMPGGERFSAIRVEADSTQRLWSFRMDGTDPRILFREVAPVGYHAWIDPDRVALFVLGDPATLQVGILSEGRARIIASDIGRSMHPVPGGRGVSFVHRSGGAPGWITLLDPDTGGLEPLIEALPENEYHAWTPSGALITARGSVLLHWRPGVDDGWVEFADLSGAGVRAISRLAVSPDGRGVVVVSER